MKTKVIPFDLEIANKVLKGEIKGKVVDDTSHKLTRILCADFGDKCHILAAVEWDGYERVKYYDEDYLHIELEEPNEPQFKPFDKVLVRDSNECTWKADIFSQMRREYYLCVGSVWRQCIPFEGNEHLLDTTDKPKEE